MPEEERSESRREADKSSGREKEKKPSIRERFKRSEGERESLKKILEEEKKRAEHYLNRLQYLQADFENYIKRVKKDSEEEIRRGNEKIIEKLLPVLDDLERAVETGKKPHSRKNNPLQEGVEMVLKEINLILQQEGLERMDPVGKPFDPAKHEAVGQVITDEAPEGTVLKELRKGYLLNGRVIRTSMVEVAKRGGDE